MEKFDKLYDFGREFKWSLSKPKEREKRVKELRDFISENFENSEYPTIVETFLVDKSLETVFEYDEELLKDIEEVEIYKTRLQEFKNNLIPQLLSDTDDKAEWIDKFLNTLKAGIAIGKLGEKIIDEIDKRLPEYIWNLSL